MEDEREDGLTALGVAGSLARRYAEDQRDFVDYLAAVLEGALPGETRVERKGGLFGDKRITALRIEIGAYTYSLTVPAHGPPQPTRTRVVRGIKLSTDTLTMDAWLESVCQAVEHYAQANRAAHDALRKLTED